MAADGLGRSRNSSVIRDLKLRLSKEGDEAVRQAIHRGLVKLGAAKEIQMPDLLLLLGDLDSEVRRLVVEELGKQSAGGRDASEQQVIIGKLAARKRDEQDEPVRHSIVRSLIRLNAAKELSVDDLLWLVNDPESEMRLQTIKEMGRRKSSEAAQPLKDRFAIERDNSVKDEIRLALRQILGGSGYYAWKLFGSAKKKGADS